MINFQKIRPENRAAFSEMLLQNRKGCEYSFANLAIWGRQQAAMVGDFLVLFCRYDRKAVYPYPVGQGEIRPVLDAIIEDAKQRGIPCCITGMSAEDKQVLETLYPGKFLFHTDRNYFDYVYDIHDLADLKGRKYQKKRNHIHRFLDAFPNWHTQPLTEENREAVIQFADQWYARRQESDPQANFHLEKIALERALADPQAYGMEGLVLMDGDRILAFTMGSFLSPDTMDIHFEKASEDADGAYPTINREFARYLRDQYPQLQYLDREDDMGLEGLRKAKLSYAPHHMVEKYWARLWEDKDEN